MKKQILLLASLLIATMSLAQTQQGYVKTLGRPDKAGEPLSGVTIRAKGQHNAVLSDSQGLFFLHLTDKQNGDAYTLQQVQKNGYELNEDNVIGKQQVFSDKVPLTLVMVSTEVLQAEKRRIESNAYKTAEKNYKTKMELLESQLRDSIITMAQYREKLLDLQDKFEKYQSLIDGLAEHYAHTDYDMLDEKDREINLCIENGDLERADSLINTLFDPIGVLERNLKALASIEQQIGQAQGIIEQANADMAAVLKQQEKDAEYLYQLYTIALARFDNEKARLYIETRAELDTTNVQWQIEAGAHSLELTADYEASLVFNRRALRQARLQYGEYNESVCNIYNQIGLCFDYMAEYDSAMFYLERMLETSIQTGGEDFFYTAVAYSHLSSLFRELDDSDKNLEYALKAFSIREKLPGQPMIAESYHNLAGYYSRNGDFDKAVEYYRKALAIDRIEKGVENFYTAYFYEGLGVTFHRMDLYDSALYYHQKSCDLREKTVGHSHPITANSYINIASVYQAIGNDSLATENYLIGIDIERKALGPNHPEMAGQYQMLGSLYSRTKNYHQALECYLRALSIIQFNFGENHPRLGIAYNQIGTTYGRLEDFDNALEYYHKARVLLENASNRNNQHLASTYNNLGSIYSLKQDYSLALEYYNKAVTLLEATIDPNHPSINKIKEKISGIQAKMSEQEN